MTEAQIKHMVSRFLAWKLPENFSPDGGITFEKSFKGYGGSLIKCEPSGTNLLDYTQAEAMVRHMIEGLPQVMLVHVDGDVLRDQQGKVVATIAGSR